MINNKFSITYFAILCMFLSACGTIEPTPSQSLPSENQHQSLENNDLFESMNDFKKIGPKPGGTVAGALYERKSDHKKYIIKYVPKEVALNELLSANFYEAAGLLVAHYILINPGNNLDNYKSAIGTGNIGYFKPPYIFVASEFIEGLVALNAHQQSKMPDILNGFIIDAWLGNYDVIGYDLDNIMQTKDKKALRADVGASLEYRAQGAPKNEGFNEEVHEIPFLLNKCDTACLKNLSLTNQTHKTIMNKSAQVFRSLTLANVEEGIKILKLFTNEKIAHIITPMPLFDDNKKHALAQLLINRRDKIINKWQPWLKKQITNNFIDP